MKINRNFEEAEKALANESYKRGYKNERDFI